MTPRRYRGNEFVVLDLSPQLLQALDPIRTRLHEQRNTILPVIGSGLSRGLLSWTKFLEDLIVKVERDEDRASLMRDLAHEKYLEVASDLQRILHPGRMADAVRLAYQRPSRSIPMAYDLVAALPVTQFATTNFDPWLKTAVGNRLRTYVQAYVPGDPGAFANIAADAPPFVLMLHGDADRPATCVLSETGFRHLSHYPIYQRALASLVGSRSLLFIGHSLTDPDLRLVLDEWQEHLGDSGAPRHWFLGVGMSSSTEHRLLDRGVVPIKYGDGNDFSKLEPVLEYLGAPPSHLRNIPRYAYAALSGVTVAGPVQPDLGLSLGGVAHLQRFVSTWNDNQRLHLLVELDLSKEVSPEKRLKPRDELFLCEDHAMCDLWFDVISREHGAVGVLRGPDPFPPGDRDYRFALAHFLDRMDLLRDGKCAVRVVAADYTRGSLHVSVP